MANASNASTGVLGYVFSNDEDAAVHAWALASAPPNETLAPPLVLDAGTFGLVVPPEALEQVATLAADVGLPREVVLLTISSFEATPELNSSNSSLISEPVHVSFRAADGQRLRVSGLRKPLELRFEGLERFNESALQQARCVFWDEDAGSWSREGLARSEQSDGFVCLTSHLTIFGVVFLEAVGRAFRCSSASDVLSVEGLQNLGTTRWLTYAATIVTFVFLAAFAAAMGWGAHLDVKTKRAFSEAEVEAVLLVSRSEERAWEEEWLRHGRSALCCWCLTSAFEKMAWLVSIVFEFEATDDVGKFANPQATTVSRCISLLHSYKAGACRESISVVMASSGERKLRSGSPCAVQGERSTSSHASAISETWDVHYHGVRAVKQYLSASWCSRVTMLLPCLHPWLRLTLMSFFSSHAMRAALVVLKVTTSAFANALFFTSAAQARDSDAKMHWERGVGF